MSSRPIAAVARKLPQQGFTLVEITMALAIGVVLVGAMLTLFAQSVQTRNQIERVGQKTEAGRFSLDMLTMELRLAGYYGEFIGNPVDTALNNLCDAGAHRTSDLGTGWTAATPTLPAAVRVIPAAQIAAGGVVDGCVVLPNHRTGTDALVVWRADTAPPATSRKKLYYIAACNDCAAADGVPTLKEMVMAAGAAPAWSDALAMVPGVEQLRVEFGFDRKPAAPAIPDGVVDYFALQPTAGDGWDDAVAARVHVLVRDLIETRGPPINLSYVLDDPVNPIAINPSDRFQRRVFSTTTVLNNVMGRRER